jgi:hypothetical protein
LRTAVVAVLTLSELKPDWPAKRIPVERTAVLSVLKLPKLAFTKKLCKVLVEMTVLTNKELAKDETAFICVSVAVLAMTVVALTLDVFTKTIEEAFSELTFPIRVVRLLTVVEPNTEVEARKLPLISKVVVGALH